MWIFWLVFSDFSRNVKPFSGSTLSPYSTGDLYTPGAQNPISKSWQKWPTFKPGKKTEKQFNFLTFQLVHPPPHDGGSTSSNWHVSCHPSFPALKLRPKKFYWSSVQERPGRKFELSDKKQRRSEQLKFSKAGKRLPPNFLFPLSEKEK